MAGIYKIGAPWGTPYDEAIAAGIAKVRETDKDEIREQGVLWTPEHEAAGEYLVKIVTV
jgi:hypothetical protein